VVGIEEMSQDLHAALTECNGRAVATADSEVVAGVSLEQSLRAHCLGLAAWLAGEGIILGKALAVNPETGCRSHLGTVEVAGESRSCVVKVYDSSLLGALLVEQESSEKTWRTESEVLKSCVAGHEDLSKPWRLPRLIASIARPGLCCNVIEFVEGESLDERLKGGKLSEDEAWNLLLEGMRGLEALHGKGFAHRDVRPPNLVMRKDGGVTLIDVNTAHEAERTSFTKLSEQAWHVIPPDAGWRDTPRDADVYALGAIVIGGLLGRAPAELLRREAPYGYLDLGLLDGAVGVSDRLRAALGRLCGTEPAMRPEANEMEILKLERLRAGEACEISASVPAAAPAGNPLALANRERHAAALVEITGKLGLPAEVAQAFLAEEVELVKRSESFMAEWDSLVKRAYTSSDRILGGSVRVNYGDLPFDRWHISGLSVLGASLVTGLGVTCAALLPSFSYAPGVIAALSYHWGLRTRGRLERQGFLSHSSFVPTPAPLEARRFAD
jgi:serine/threonine protein kinase